MFYVVDVWDEGEERYLPIYRTLYGTEARTRANEEEAEGRSVRIREVQGNISD